jgi:hypothetical protein
MPWARDIPSVRFDTFAPKAVKLMMETQAKWTHGDLERLKLIG